MATHLQRARELSLRLHVPSRNEGGRNREVTAWRAAGKSQTPAAPKFARLADQISQRPDPFNREAPPPPNRRRPRAQRKMSRSVVRVHPVIFLKSKTKRDPLSFMR